MSAIYSWVMNIMAVTIQRFSETFHIFEKNSQLLIVNNFFQNRHILNAITYNSCILQ